MGTSGEATRLVLAAGAGAAVTWLLIKRSSGSSLTDRVAKLLCEYLNPESMAQRPVVKLRSPDEIEAAFSSAGCPLTLAASDAPSSDDTLLAACVAYGELETARQVLQLAESLSRPSGVTFHEHTPIW